MIPPRREIELGRGGGFCAFRQQGLYTVDKTLFIQHVIEAPYMSMLIPRPRRFGKTFNITTLKDFLERPASPERAEQIRTCFEGSKIWDVPSARRHFQQYPVLHFSFRACKAAAWAGTWHHIRQELSKMFEKHRLLLDVAGALSPGQAQWFRRGLEQSLSSDDFSLMLEILSQALFRLSGMPVVILIDEYDTPIHAALEHGYYAEAIAFFKRFLTLGFKDNDFLYKGVITGILRVSKENMFSDLNNVGVYSLLADAFVTDFGLTQEDVIQVLADQGCPELLPDIERMYNGYLFGHLPQVAIYNPWSTLSCIANPKHTLQPYWHGSGSPELLHTLVVKNGPLIHRELQQLLDSQTLETVVTEHVNLTALESSPVDLFSFMLFTGYLKASAVERDGDDFRVCLTLVNQELHAILSTLYRKWLGRGDANFGADPLLKAVLGGEALALQERLESILLHNASFLDGATRTPENFYQGLMLGLLVLLKQDYEVVSNLESGKGRADLLLLPRMEGKTGVVMELKVVKQGGTHAEALLAGLTQIQTKRYTARLEERHAQPIFVYAVAFDGKDVRVAVDSDRPALEEELLRRKQEQEAQARATLASTAVFPAGSLPGAPSRRIPVQERLALERLIVPRLTASDLRSLWSLCGFEPPIIRDDSLIEGWHALVLRCSVDGLLSDLVEVLGFTFRELEGHPILEKLRENGKPTV